MNYLFISAIINAIILCYLIIKIDKLQEQINELKRKQNEGKRIKKRRIK